MNGVSRFLSRREKHYQEKRASKHLRNKSRTSNAAAESSELYKVFTQEDKKSSDKDGDKKTKMLVHRLQASGITNLNEEHAEHALSWYPDDIDAAYDLLALVNESFEGELKDYDDTKVMQGAVNRNMVTCYLDSLLFAMFARLDSFEAMLYDEFNDIPRKKLAGVLRLWVNLLRTGRLIKPDLTKHLQDSLAACGWEDAALTRQQDASEAFTFITGALELPLLTLKMDIFHTGRENKEDDHKFVNERLLEVAIPEQEGDEEVTLEQCLETYFNNRIEVKRHLQRQNTLTSIHTVKETEKSEAIHIEAIELVSSPTSDIPTPIESSAPATPISPTRPGQARRRGDSIFAERYSGRSAFDEKKHLDEMLGRSSDARPRAASIRKEVMMPAWQFFSLIPWYTDNIPRTDAQVAAHFSTKRPVLGICLKRYMMTNTGAPKRLNTYIDIPLEIGLPHFISDDRMHEEGPLFGNFKLVLQSVVCHRGASVDSGHYIALVRANKSSAHRPGTGQSEEEEKPDSWLRFDDIANPRVAEVEIQKALREESPYLLFYQVQPIDEELASRGDPPPYVETEHDEAEPAPLTADPSKETLVSEVSSTGADASEWDRVSSSEAPPTVLEATIVEPHLNAAASEPIGRVSFSSIHRNSLEFEGRPRGRSNPSTPDEQKSSFLSASRRNSRAWLASGSKHGSRPSSQNGENRLSITISRLTGRGSKDKLHVAENKESPDDPVIVISEGQILESDDAQTRSPVKDKERDKKGEGGSGSGTTGQSKSKRAKKDKEEKKGMLGRSKSVEALNGIVGRDKEKGKKLAKERPDRECLVM